MTRDQIIKALSGDDYQALLVIYKKYKINNKLDAFFAQQQNPSRDHLNFSMLHRKVKDIFRKLEQNNAFNNEDQSFNRTETDAEISVRETNFKPKNIVRPVIDSNPHVNRADLPEDLQFIYDQNGKMNSEMKSKHALMSVETNDANRKVLVNELCELEDKMNANWSKIDKWYQDSIKDKKDEASAANDPVKTANKIEAAKRYIDRYYDSKKPVTIAEVQERTKYLKSLGIDYLARPLRDNKKTAKPKNKKK
jgi:hypothetical protein